MKTFLCVASLILSACATPPPSCSALPDGLTPEVIEMCKAVGCTLIPGPTWDKVEGFLVEKGYHP